MTASVRLDDAQRRVAEAAADERLFVTAGPGSGKTETVSARIDYLVDDQGLAGNEILVISFSRAAVEAVQRRQRSGGRSWAWVTTIDSLTSRLLSDQGEEFEKLGFDARIDRLLRILGEGPDEEILSDVCHVIIDEVQDVVGRRARLIAALLLALPASVGFTMLGDPKQGIYDFQLDEDEGEPDALLHSARVMGATEVGLRGQYRADTRDAARAMATRGGHDGTGWLREMQRFVSSMPSFDSRALAEEVARQEGTIAILTQSNAQALTTAKALHGAGVPAELLARASDRPIDPWLAAILGEGPESLTMDSFVEAVADRAPIDPTEAWGLCRRITRADTKFLNVRQLAQRLAMGVVPVALTSARRRITISTVHRAKGLEFDHVFLLDPEEWYVQDAEDLARTLYVAITRPRRRLFLFQDDPNARRWKTDPRTERAYRTNFRGKGTTGFEIRGSDWRGTRPPGADDDPTATRSRLLELAAEGKPVPVDIRLDAYGSTLREPKYDAYVDDLLIGTLGDSFIHGFTRRTGDSRGRWPDFRSVHFTGVETVAGPPQIGQVVGGNGLWLSPLIVGAASLDWSTHE